MRLQHALWTGLLALLVTAGLAAAQDCPECDADGEPDESWYSSVDTGVIGEDEGVLSDSDASVGEGQHGKFTWLQYCLQAWDFLGNSLVVMFEVFASEDGVDVDGSVSVNDESVDLEDTPVGDLDDGTWGNMPEAPADLPPFDPDAMPVEGQDVDSCLFLEESDAVTTSRMTATCEAATG